MLIISVLEEVSNALIALVLLGLVEFGGHSLLYLIPVEFVDDGEDHKEDAEVEVGAIAEDRNLSVVAPVYLYDLEDEVGEGKEHYRVLAVLHLCYYGGTISRPKLADSLLGATYLFMSRYLSTQ